MHENILKNLSYLDINKVYHYASIIYDNRIVELIPNNDKEIYEIPIGINLDNYPNVNKRKVIRYHNNEWHVFYNNIFNSNCYTCFIIKHNQSSKMREISKKNLLNYIENNPKYKESQLNGAIASAKNLHEKLAKDPEKQRIIALNALSHITYEKKYCKECHAITTHKCDNCIVCNPDIAGNAINKITSFTIGEYCSKHIFCNKKYYDINCKKYVCWECFKESFNSLEYDILFKDYKWVNTYRNLNNWSGARNAFEERLKELNVRWFTYIKFYINENKIKPIIVGMSGSELVNASGSDVNFNMTQNSPGRLFLKENNYEFYTDAIMIKSFNTKQESLNEEKFIKEKYNLFYS